MVRDIDVKRGWFFILFIFMVLFFGDPATGFSEEKLIDTEDYALSMASYFRTDVVTLKNNVDLDSNNSDDTSSYMGIDYSLGFDFKSKTKGPEYYLKLERNGPYDYNAPLFIHNALRTSTARVEKYRDEELLPQVEEFWGDLPIGGLPLQLKAGLYPYEAGNGISLGGAYENYGLGLTYSANERLKFRFYYARPDWEKKSYLGERPTQDKQQGINYQHSRANFFSLDSNILLGSHAIQPYVGVLIDTTNAKRASNFSAPTRKDTLGTFGASWAVNADKLSLNLETARNFGKAKSSDEAFKDVEHTGYAFYSDASYALGRFTPHARFLYASGNRITTEMIDNGDTVLTSGKNRAFSAYSPFNTNLADSFYPSFSSCCLPIVAAGDGYGLNYGVPRPTTFADPRLPDNLILPGLGLDWESAEKISLAFNWWYLKSAERGVGTYNGITKNLSSYLGQEVDLICTYALSDNASLSLSQGYFFPGKYYKEERDDTGGSLFSPFVRGDGKANSAYQIELSLILSF